MKGIRALTIAAVAFAGVLTASTQAQIITLTDNGSAVDLLNDGSIDAGTALNWYVDGVDHLFRESYFFRRTNSGAVTPIGGLGNIAGFLLLPNIAKFYYGDIQNGVSAEVTYLLTGDSGTADLAETVKIKNNSNTTIHFELFEYDDFDLGGTSGDDSAHKNNANSIGQQDANISLQAEVVTAPAAAFTEVNGFPTLLNKMLDPGFTNLDSSLTDYSGDATFAFQWVFDLAPGQSFIMSKDKLLAVPEPSTLVAFAGLAAVALRRRGRK